MNERSHAAWRRASFVAVAATWALLVLVTWVRIPDAVPLVGGIGAPDWSASPDVSGPMTRLMVLYHPPSAWASFAAYLVTFAFSVAVLNERDRRHDQAARAAAEVGFLLNSVALATGTLWGLQEWSRDGQAGLATVYSEPKVLVVVVLWLTFAAYLLLRRFVDAPERRARLGAVFAVLGFILVPASFLTSRLVATSLHPDIAGPGANPDAAQLGSVGPLMLIGFLAFLALFVHLFLQRLRIARLEDDIEARIARTLEN